MAVSAFRSTTKRTQVGPSNRNGKQGSGFSEPNSKYFSDSSSMSGPRFGDSRRPRASSRRHSSVDSESDADGSSRQYHRSSRRGGRDGSESDGAAFRSLRRASSQSEKSRKEGLFTDNEEVSGDEMQVEERTIRAVHAQMKQLRNKNPTEDLDVLGLYDAMKAEVRQAIADLKQEIRQSGTQRRDGLELDDLDIRKEYAQKLEESERRANDLWSELAQEEQRCMNLSKMVKELLPDSASRVQKRAYRSKRYLNQRQVVSQSLDEDARKFFQDCVTVSRLDCRAEEHSDFSERSSVVSTEFTEPEAAKVTPLDQESVASALPEQPDREAGDEQVKFKAKQEEQGEQTPEVEGVRRSSKAMLSPSKDDAKRSPSSSARTSDSSRRSKANRRAPVNVDGVVMPWLEWETGSESSRRSRAERTKHSCEELNLLLNSGSTSGVNDEESHWDSTLSSEVDELLPHRIRFTDRILSGRMHLCTDVF